TGLPRRSASRLDYTIGRDGAPRRTCRRLLVPRQRLAERGPDRAIRDPRAPPRPPGGGDRRGSLRHEQALAGADPARAGATGRDPRRRRGHRRLDAVEALYCVATTVLCILTVSWFDV